MEKSIKSYTKELFKIGKGILILILLILLYGLPDILLYLPIPDMIIAILLSVMSIFIIKFYIRYYLKGVNRNEFYIVPKKPTKRIILFLILMGGIISVIDWTFTSLLVVETPENQKLLEEIFLNTPLSIAVSGVIIAPICEELFSEESFLIYFIGLQFGMGKF